jgi:hypothetical protein
VPFAEEALRHLVYLERPEEMDLDDAASFSAAQHSRPLTVDDRPLVAVPQEWRTVGHLYRGIEEGLAHLCERYGQDAVFSGPTTAQAVTNIFEWPELIALADLASARQAIQVIIEEGEGARGDWIKSHFGTFVGILEDLLARQAADPKFNPARPVEPTFVRLPPTFLLAGSSTRRLPLGSRTSTTRSTSSCSRCRVGTTSTNPRARPSSTPSPRRPSTS